MMQASALGTDDSGTTVSVQMLLDERHALRERSLQQPVGAGRWMGNFRGARRGQGTDFDDLRHYSAGDDLRHIDWKASARTNSLHTRLYREEREHRVTVVTDLRDIMFNGSRQLRAVTACRLTARLLWQAVEGGSRISVIVAGDAGISVSQSDGGHRAAIDCCGLLARRFSLAREAARSQVRQTHNAEAQSNTAGNEQDQGITQSQTDLTAMSPDPVLTLPPASNQTAGPYLQLEQISSWLLTQRQLPGTLIWVSGFDHTGTGFDDSLQIVSEASDQVAVHIDEPMLELGLPSGHYGYRATHEQQQSSHGITLNAPGRAQLIEQLINTKDQREQRFDKLMIPLLGTADGFAEVVARLRQGGYLP